MFLLRSLTRNLWSDQRCHWWLLAVKNNTNFTDFNLASFYFQCSLHHQLTKYITTDMFWVPSWSITCHEWVLEQGYKLQQNQISIVFLSSIPLKFNFNFNSEISNCGHEHPLHSPEPVEQMSHVERECCKRWLRMYMYSAHNGLTLVDKCCPSIWGEAICVHSCTHRIASCACEPRSYSALRRPLKNTYYAQASKQENSFKPHAVKMLLFKYYIKNNSNNWD